MNKYLSEAEQLFHKQRYTEAAVLCKKAMRKPLDVVRAKHLMADCYYNQGVIHVFGSGLLGEAEKHFRMAIEQYPQHTDALNNLAALLIEQGRIDEAIEHYRKILTIDPSRLTVYRDVAVAYQRLDRLEEASAVLEKMAELMPLDGSALLRNALLLRSIMPDAAYPVQVRERINIRLAAFEAADRPIADPAWFSGTYFYLSFHGLCNKDLHRKIAAVHIKAAPSLVWRSPSLDGWAGAPGRIRIGLASSFLFNHSIGHTTRGMVEKLDRSRFEVVVIRLGNAPADEIAKSIDRTADRVERVALDTLQGAREHIAGLGLDILFWQDIGMDPYSYLLSFSRLAPVQLTSFGHPDTTGIPNVDYFLSSELYETSESSDHYSERLVCIPGAGTLAYYHRPMVPAGMIDLHHFGVKEGDHIYLCPQTLFKLHPDMDDIFLDIVDRDARARILLIDPGKGRMRQQLEARFARLSGNLSKRICFIKRLEYQDYLRLIRCADVVLDTLHFNGQNTSLESFAMGIPIVTLPGTLHRSRHTFGMYRAMDFMDLVAKNKADYADKALAVVNSTEFRTHCRERIQASAGSLYENQGFITHCEQAFEAMVERVTPHHQP